MSLLNALSDLYFKSEYPARLAVLRRSLESNYRRNGDSMLSNNIAAVYTQALRVVTKQNKGTCEIFRMQ